MSLDAVILACAADREQAARLTEGLGTARLKVQLVIAGEGPLANPVIPDAPCRVLAITRSSDCAAWLAAAAQDVAADGRAIAVRLEAGAEPPVPLSTYDYLSHGFISRLIGKACLSDIAAAIRAIQQNTFPPSPTARWRMVLGRLWVYLVALGAVIGVVGYFVPWSEVLQSMDWAEQAAWEELRSGNPDCAAFDAFLDRHPNGRHAAEVRDALANPDKETRYVPDVTRLTISGPLFTGDGYSTRDAAVQAARDWAEGDAQRQCGNLSERLGGRSWSAQLGPLTENCQQFSGRWMCAVEGSNACRVEAPVEIAVCRLGAKP